MPIRIRDGGTNDACDWKRCDAAHDAYVRSRIVLQERGEDMGILLDAQIHTGRWGSYDGGRKNDDIAAISFA